jgi:outer membrane protein OmpU
MKKSLLATTAIAALGAVVVAAPASAKFEVGVSGYMEQWFGYSDNADTVQNSDVFDSFSDSEFFIGFKQTLDNGLEIGGEIQVEGQQASAEQIDEQYIFINGSFGRIEIGTDNGAGYRMHYGLKSNGVGIDEGDVDEWIANSNSDLRTTSATTSIDNDANKITYFSPRISGFQIGASFVPENEVNTSEGAAAGGKESDDVRDSGFILGANYVTSVADMSIKASVGYADAGGGVPGKQEAMSAGIQLGFGGFTASFAYGEHEDDTDVSDENIFGASLAYNAGPAGVSIAYIRGEDSDTNDEQDAIEVGASYQVGPGVSAKTSLYYLERSTNGADTADGIGVVAGLALSF